MLLAVFADKNGQAFEDSRYLALGRTGNSIVEVISQEFIPLPSGSSLMVLPQRYPVGINRSTGSFSAITDEGLAVAALLPQGYTRTLLPAYVKQKNAQTLPLFGYAAVAWHVEEERFYVAAAETDADKHKWQPHNYNTNNLRALIDAKIKLLPNNRIISQLAKCAGEYSCFTAQNVFYERWEGGIPVSPTCNAQCIGCISEQISQCCPSPQQRITYVPTVTEVSDIMISHLATAPEGIISFGQGCEGEPILQAKLIKEAIQKTRCLCNKGIINCNTNAGYTEGIRMVSEAGIDMLRVSMISANSEHYNAYYRPKSYNINDVKNSIKIARANGVFVSLNWLTTPGVTDDESELVALIKLIKECDVNMVQFRNLNLDPDLYEDIYDETFSEQPLGILAMIDALKAELPALKFGNFTKSKI